MPRFLLAGLAGTLFALPAAAQEAGKNRGDLDPQYCDENGDLVADTPVEDPAVYEKETKREEEAKRKAAMEKK